MKAVQLVCGLAFFLYLPSLGQTKHFVKQTAAGTGTGLGSWANAAGAAQLQGILAAAASGDTVWIAAGVYYPTAYPAGSTGGATNRDFAFALTNGVAVYGGFAGTESFLSQRNVATHVTSLSGDIGTAGNVTDNCYHVIATYNMSNTAILDGVKIDSGEANGTGSITIGGQAFSRATGAGICAMKSQPILANCTFIANQAGGEGGALYLGNCNAFPVTSCAFTSNTAQGNGGAISKETSSPVTFSGCTFTGNYSFVAAGTTGGGAIYSNSGSGDVIHNCVFTGNHAVNAYGGAFFFNGTSTLTMSYTTLTQNVAATYGGGMANTGGTSFTITHCNFNNNNASMGGGIYSSGGSCLYAYDTIANNTSTSTTGAGGGGFYNDATNPVISHCLIRANVTNGGNGAGQYDNGGASPQDSNTVFQANIAGGSASNGGGYYHTAGTGFFVNCVFVDNRCAVDGGGYYNNSTQPVENCTFYNNTAGSSGGGFYDVGGEGVKFYNNMLWNNNPDNFYTSSTASLKLKYNDFPEAALYPAGGSVVGNIAQTPTFYNSGNYAGPDGQWGTIDDGLHLNSAAGTGGADGVPPNGTNGSYGWVTDDIAEAVRPDAGANAADIGAYEGAVIPLALSLLQFYEDESNVLHWAVASPVSGFVLTRSYDGVAFAPLVSLDSDVMSYADTAAAPLLYYRLEVLFADGSAEWSGVVVVRRSALSVALRPNPVGSSAVLYASAPASLQGSLVDASGRVVRTFQLTVTAGDNLLQLTGLAPGVYFLELTATNGWRRVLPLVKG
ncbi:MAG TPA: T9SS type A sorting domain-containing protein [Dinghuibacter sp.]|uniref:T9SS type A sorting domain-containing protein n=1 Tax=Dinghuibacter sp. TaxID=2024697 RepID=UPI002BF80A3D|nr:T9SS type A sorting domain-containing protein [Dinghuibacter sp.]HTJ12962.1 T9SS type A sorting domain-containing protein [Dinghuibacter sp.]